MISFLYKIKKCFVKQFRSLFVIWVMLSWQIHNNNVAQQNYENQQHNSNQCLDQNLVLQQKYQNSVPPGKTPLNLFTRIVKCQIVIMPNISQSLSQILDAKRTAWLAKNCSVSGRKPLFQVQIHIR